MKNWMKPILGGVLTAAICVACIIGVTMIPRSAISEGVRHSAEYLEEREVFAKLGGSMQTIQDNFSDAILLNIIYSAREDHPLDILEAKYYHPGNMEATDALLASVQDEVVPDMEYARYWHGTSIYVRPLLLFLSISEIRLFIGSLIVGGLLVMCILLWRRGEKKASVALLLAFLGVYGPMVFLSLEYSTAFLIMTVVSVLCLWKCPQRELSEWGTFFACSGVLIAFFDFLTTETLTLTLPLVFIFLYAKRKKEYVTKEKWKILLKNTLCWGVGYGGMYGLKWGLVYAMLGKETFLSSIEEGLFRLNGTVYMGNSNLFPEATQFEKYIGAIWHNLAMLFPFDDTDIRMTPTVVATLGMLFVLGAFVYVFHQKINWSRYSFLWLVAAVPFLRFLVLANHSYIHFFFSYRALMTSGFVLWLFVLENGMPQKKKK